MADGGRRMADGGRRTADGGWRMADVFYVEFIIIFYKFRTSAVRHSPSDQDLYRKPFAGTHALTSYGHDFLNHVDSIIVKVYTHWHNGP